MKLPRINVLKTLKSIGKGLFSLTLIPYAIATYKELKTVDWMSYWQTIRVTAFVILFSVVTAALVFGIDQVVVKIFTYLKVA